MLVANHSSSYTYTIHKCAGAGKHTIPRTFAKSRPTMRFPVRSHTTSKTVTERSKASVFIWACFIYIVFSFNDALLATQVTLRQVTNHTMLTDWRRIWSWPILRYYSISFIYSMFRALISFIQFLKIPTNTLECTTVSLLYSNHRHVSATHVAIFRLVKTRIQSKL
jgi:hypothetical protein